MLLIGFSPRNVLTLFVKPHFRPYGTKKMTGSGYQKPVSSLICEGNILRFICATINLISLKFSVQEPMHRLVHAFLQGEPRPICEYNIYTNSLSLNRLYSDIVNDSLTEFSYDATLAGLSYNFAPHQTGLYVTMNGYNDKMSVLVRHVLDKVKRLVVDPKRLAVVKEEVNTLFIPLLPFLNPFDRLEESGRISSLDNRIRCQITMDVIS